MNRCHTFADAAVCTSPCSEETPEDVDVEHSVSVIDADERVTGLTVQVSADAASWSAYGLTDAELPAALEAAEAIAEALRRHEADRKRRANWAQVEGAV